MGIYLDWTILLLLPGIIVSAWAQFRLRSSFAKYSKIMNRGGYRANEVARAMLKQGGLSIGVEPVAGELTDHYSPKEGILRLSDPIYDASSIAALGVAAHEVGHALQDKDGYMPLRLLHSVVPFANIGSYMAMPLVFLGIILSVTPLIHIGIIAFSLAVLYYLVTLPVEFDASRRALQALEATGYLQMDEIAPAKRVLNAAAMTYVASALTALLQLLRLLAIANRRRN